MEKEKVNIFLDDDEARLFIELRRINMDTGSVHLNYQFGKIKSIDEYRHKKLSKNNVDNPPIV